MEEFGLELHPLLVGLIHDVTILLQLRQFDFIVSDLLVALPLDVLDLCLEASDDLIVVALILLLQLRDLILQADGLLQLPVVIRLQLPLHLRLVYLRLSESLVHHPQLVLPSMGGG